MKTYTKKNGEVKIYDQKEYNRRHYENNKVAILADTYTCLYCTKEVNERCRSNHEKSLKHKLYHQIHQQNNVGQ